MINYLIKRGKRLPLLGRENLGMNLACPIQWIFQQHEH